MLKHQKQWEFLKNKIESNRLAHAYLFSGKDIEAINFFAKNFVKFINCLTSDVKQGACDKCHNCLLIEKEAFPDLLVVKSENSKSSIKNDEDKGEIDIGQIRDVNKFLGMKPYYGSFKAVLVENAERLNTEAQSCLLKTLEEPKGKTLIILVAANPEVLLPTIRSRCQAVRFSSATQGEFSVDEIGIAREFARVSSLCLAEKFTYAKNMRLDNGNFEKILNATRKYFRNILLEKTGAATTKNNFNGAKTDNFSVLKIKKILDIIEDISHKSLMYNINPRLSLEILLMEI